MEVEGFALTAVPPVSAPTVIDESVTPLLCLVTALTDCATGGERWDRSSKIIVAGRWVTLVWAVDRYHPQSQCWMVRGKNVK